MSRPVYWNNFTVTVNGTPTYAYEIEYEIVVYCIDPGCTEWVYWHNKASLWNYNMGEMVDNMEQHWKEFHG